MNKMILGILISILGVSASVPTFAQNDQRTEKPAPHKKSHKGLNYSLPIYTARFAMACPLSVLSDNRESRSPKAINEAMLSVFGREEAIEKVGCEQWKAGIRIYIPSTEIPKKDGYVHWLSSYQNPDFSGEPVLIPDAYLTNNGNEP